MENTVYTPVREDFVLRTPSSENDTLKEGIAVKRVSKVRLFMHNKAGVAGLIIVAVLILLSIFVPLFAPHTFDDQDLQSVNLAPDSVYWFGTDQLGRDLFTRCFMGLRVSLVIAVAAAVIDLVIGMNYGLISGYFGGKTDLVMQRIVDILGSIPMLIIVTLLMLVLKPGMFTIILALMITGWMEMSLIARSHVLKIKNLDFVQAARTLGASNFHIITKEIIPNTIGHLFPQLMLTIPSAIFFETFLSFVGLGMPVGSCSLGTLLSTGFNNVLIYPYQMFPPAIVMITLMISCHLIARGLEKSITGTSD